MNNRTKKGYLKMIYDFIIFSPDIDSEDLENFMEHKFKITPLNSQFKTPYKGTQAKYAIILKRSLKRIYTIDDIDVKVSHYRKKIKNGKEMYHKVTHQDVFKAYEELSSLKQYQDAVILHAMYALSLNPYSIYLLTYEGIKEGQIIEYWDHKSSKTMTIDITYELLNDLNFYSIYTNSLNIMIRDTFRKSPDGAIITGTFIFTLSPTNIYNLFKWQFGNKLKWFKFTSLNIVQLSKHRRKTELQGLSPKLNNNYG